ncbi:MULTISPECIES: hypothetical protein [Bacteria]|jgi:predicted nuclease with TOPRIM domain
MLKRFRTRLDAAVARRVDRALKQLRDEIDVERENLRGEREEYEARLRGNQADFSFLRSEFDRLAPQLASLEVRFERLRNELDLPPLNPDTELQRARAEHERARLRLQAVSRFEERLRRLEHDRAD